MNFLKKPWVLGLVLGFIAFWVIGYFFDLGVDNLVAAIIFILPFFLISGVALAVVIDSIVKIFKFQKINWLILGIVAGILFGIFFIPLTWRFLLGKVGMDFKFWVYSILISGFIGGILGFFGSRILPKR